MKSYKKQNRIQKEISEIVERFKPSPLAIERLNKKGMGVYVPKLNKVRLAVGSGIMALLLITPFTNWLSFLVIKWALK